MNYKNCFKKNWHYHDYYDYYDYDYYDYYNYYDYEHSVLEDKGVLKMDFSLNKTPIEVIKEGAFEVLILETFILMLIRNGTRNHGKNLIS